MSFSDLKTLLIVDDNMLNRRILNKILSSDYNILEAENGAEALNMLKLSKIKVSAIILDWYVPKMNGCEFLKVISQIDNLKHIPVIVLTGSNEKDDEIMALKLGAYDYVSKPFDPQILKFRIKNAIDRSQLSILAQLKYLAEYDEMTGIFNKSKFYKNTSAFFAVDDKEKYAIIRIDIDRFNLINSFYGIDEGDKLLKYIANVIKNYCSKIGRCTFGRIEADVFGICMPFIDEYSLIVAMNDIKKRIKNYNDDYDISPSFGVYVVTDKKMTVDVMFERANLASKTIKGSYIKSYSFYDEKIGENLLKQQEIINDMEDALINEQFEVYLQPKYSLQTNTPAGAEALVRWLHPKKGMIMPSDFIPIFERNGFISKLDFYVWEKTCKLLRQWIDAGKNPHPISVNVSRVNLYNPNLVAIICGLVDKYNINPSLFNLELTETAYTDNPIVMQEAINKLKDKGFIIMMDDFGSGYSSLNILKDISVDVIKIDMKFLSTTSIPGRGENIIASIVRMTKWLNIKTIIEGVEKSEQVEFLRGIGCDYVQGFYYAKPMPISDYEKYIDSKVVYKTQDNKTFDADSLWVANPQMEIVFSSVMQAVGIYEYKNGKINILRVNDAFYNLFGYDDIAISIDDPLTLVSKETAQNIVDAFEFAIKNEDTSECEYLRSINGSDRKIWVNLRLKYINQVGGKYIFFGTLRDITQQRNLYSELQKYRFAISSESSQTNNLLIVDNDKEIRNQLRKMLEDEFTVYEAENGKEAISLIEENDYKMDIILLDLKMPVMNGEEFLNYKKEQRKMLDIPVIIITDNHETQQQANTLSLGASDYIVKPFIKEIIIRRINNVLDSSRRFKEILREYNGAVKNSKSDMLTKVYNRTTGEALTKNILNVKSNRQHVLIVADIDNFQHINNVLGYEYGNKVLTNIADILKNFFRTNDIVFRIGGDEFCILMTNIPSMETVYTKCCELCQKINNIQIENQAYKLSVSIGIALINNSIRDYDKIFANAIDALEKSKQTGKNTVTIYDDKDIITHSVPYISKDLILDTLDDAIFIFNEDTYETIYLSKTASELCNAKKFEGNKCYEILHGKDKPCENCNKDKLLYNKWHHKILFSENLNKNFILKEKKITLNGINAQLKVASEIDSEENFDNIAKILKPNTKQ